MIEVYKYLHGLSPELMTDTFTLRKNPYNICNIRLFGSENPRSVRFGVDAVVAKSAHRNKRLSSLEIFKAEIKSWSCDGCRCNLCKRLPPM